MANLETARRVLREEAAALGRLADSLGGDFETAVEWILNCKGRVATCGLGKSGHIARKAAGTLSSTGTPSLFLHAGEAVHGDLGMVTGDDIVILYSHSGETDELIRLFPSLATIGAKTVLITGRPRSSAGSRADVVLDTGVSREACPEDLAPTTSTTAMLALSDALAIEVMVRRGFSRDDFAKFHPSGTLGRRLLLKVSDVMRKNGDNAVVSTDTPLVDVLRAITKAGAGAACIVNAEGTFVGLISDGDLRRQFLTSADPLGVSAGEVMTRNPATLSPNLLAVEALEAFQNLPKKVGEMPVVSEGRVLGILVLKDLLRSGIV